VKDKAATRADVARLAGVSKSTVSRVLNDSGYVAEESRRRIKAAIDELGYSPNPIARGLKTNRTNQMLYFAPDYRNPFYMEVYNGMEDYAASKGYTIVVSDRVDEKTLHHRRFDGIIVADVTTLQSSGLLELETPAVVTAYERTPSPFPSVNLDYHAGMELAVRHVFDLGHRSVGFATFAAPEANPRSDSFHRCLEEYGLPHTASRVAVGAPEHRDYRSGYEAAERLLNANPGTTAIIAHNDIVAIGAMAYAQRRGLRVPEDLSIMGFDDIAQAAYTNPGLTTVAVPKYELGEESVKLLLRVISGESGRPGGWTYTSRNAGRRAGREHSRSNPGRSAI
jgi:LacI family transcriptional regulator